MKKVGYETQGTCSRYIEFYIDDDKRVHDISFTGGCNGNLKAVSKLCEGMEAQKLISILKGNTCGPKSTSCADQLSRAVAQAIGD